MEAVGPDHICFASRLASCSFDDGQCGTPKAEGHWGLMLINPSILKLGAAIDVVCFDKTGTLTASAVSLIYVGFFAACTSRGALRPEE